MDSSSQTETWGNTDRDGGKWTALHKQKHGETLTGMAVNGQIFTNRNMGKH